MLGKRDKTSIRHSRVGICEETLNTAGENHHEVSVIIPMCVRSKTGNCGPRWRPILSNGKLVLKELGRVQLQPKTQTLMHGDLYTTLRWVRQIKTTIKMLESSNFNDEAKR